MCTSSCGPSIFVHQKQTLHLFALNEFRPKTSNSRVEITVGSFSKDIKKASSNKESFPSSCFVFGLNAGVEIVIQSAKSRRSEQGLTALIPCKPSKFGLVNYFNQSIYWPLINNKAQRRLKIFQVSGENMLDCGLTRSIASYGRKLL